MEQTNALCWAYLVRCADGSYYAGWTDDLPRRLAAHNRGAGAKYTRSRRPVVLAYREPCGSRREALAREAWLKTLTHREKAFLARQGEFRPGPQAPGLVVWDFNGTLLDDAALCLGTVNGMLTRRGIAPLTPRRYRAIFDFPVEDYYRRAGFDLEREPFAPLAVEFVEAYNRERESCPLQKGALAALELVRKAGIPQVILSATQREMLAEQVAQLGIGGYFRELVGTDDIHARGKLEVGLAWLARRGIDPAAALYIGDTTHDADLARAMGMPCLLVPGGHHSLGRLQARREAVTLPRPSALPSALARRLLLPPPSPGEGGKGPR